ncbi:MAG: peptidoglycan-binding protein [Verrucomicrobiota bacterium]|nr:peptidoglycan-binding protein [Verrucomicrobiota bacterium]
MRSLRLFYAALVFTVSLGSAAAFELPYFHNGDPLAPRDEWGQLHQMGTLNETDLVQRERWRLFYYAKSGRDLMNDRAYVGSLQVSLQRTGYYCGPIDGYYSPDVTDAVMRFQKAHRMRVSGNLTIAVRRALHMP